MAATADVFQRFFLKQQEMFQSNEKGICIEIRKPGPSLHSQECSHLTVSEIQTVGMTYTSLPENVIMTEPQPLPF